MLSPIIRLLLNRNMISEAGVKKKLFSDQLSAPKVARQLTRIQGHVFASDINMYTLNLSW